MQTFVSAYFQAEYMFWIIFILISYLHQNKVRVFIS